MIKKLTMLVLAVMMVAGSLAWADDYSDAIDVFKKAGESAAFFKDSYGYAIFPSIAKGGLGVGAAHGKGRVYEKGKHIGDTAMTQVSVGLQAGGQAFSQIIFFENKAAQRQFRVRRRGECRGDQVRCVRFGGDYRCDGERQQRRRGEQRRYRW